MNLINTSKIISMIKKSKTPQIIADKEVLPDIQPQEYLKELIREKGMTEQQLLLELCLERTYAYRIMNGKRKPTRNILLRIALWLKLSLNETQRLLKFFGRVELLSHRRFDSVIIFSLENKLNVFQTDEILQQIGEKTLIEDT